MTEFLCEPLGRQHDREGFQCGVAELDRWLQQRARQDQERRVAAVYVLVPKDEPKRIAGFYTLSATAIALADLPDSFVRRLPRYPHVPAILIGRLARAVDFQGIGDLLLSDALKRAWRHSSEIAAAAIVVDAKSERACEFYQRYGFEIIVGSSDRLFLPICTLDKLFKP
jgi:GNAT superfamily N-acetyltransferase